MKEQGKSAVAVDDLRLAEQQANKWIAESNKEKENAPKEAKIAAEKEIEKIQGEYQVKLAQHIKNLSHHGKGETLEKTTSDEIRKIYANYREHEDALIALLIERVKTVHLQLPKTESSDLAKFLAES